MNMRKNMNFGENGIFTFGIDRVGGLFVQKVENGEIENITQFHAFTLKKYSEKNVLALIPKEIKDEVLNSPLDDNTPRRLALWVDGKHIQSVTTIGDWLTAFDKLKYNLEGTVVTLTDYNLVSLYKIQV